MQSYQGLLQSQQELREINNELHKNLEIQKHLHSSQATRFMKMMERERNRYKRLDEEKKKLNDELVSLKISCGILKQQSHECDDELCSSKGEMTHDEKKLYCRARDDCLHMKCDRYKGKFCGNCD